MSDYKKTLFDKIDGKTYLKNMIAPVCVIVLITIIQLLVCLNLASHLATIPSIILGLTQLFFIWIGLYHTIRYLELSQCCKVSFAGRMTRKAYWTWALIMVILSPMLLLSLFYLAQFIPLIALILLLVIWIYLSLLGLACTFQRLHDVGKSGNYIFILLIPFYGIAMYLIALTTDSVRGENEYGTNPKGIN